MKLQIKKLVNYSGELVKEFDFQVPVTIIPNKNNVTIIYMDHPEQDLVIELAEGEYPIIRNW